MGDGRDFELIPGSIYFALFFEDEDLQIPDIHTLRYQESRRRDDGSCELWFENLRSDVEGAQVFFLEDEPGDTSELIHDLQGLIKALVELKARHGAE